MNTSFFLKSDVLLVPSQQSLSGQDLVAQLQVLVILIIVFVLFDGINDLDNRGLVLGNNVGSNHFLDGIVVQFI